MCICYSYYLSLFCNFGPLFLFTLFRLLSPTCVLLQSHFHARHKTATLAGAIKTSAFKVRINVCRGWMQTSSNAVRTHTHTHSHTSTHTHTLGLSCGSSWSIAEPAEQDGSFIMIAAGISGHNYQRRLIHSLIASFNLFTFGAEQCQPAAVESNLLQGRVTYTTQNPSVHPCRWKRVTGKLDSRTT